MMEAVTTGSYCGVCVVKWQNLGLCFAALFSTIHDRSFSTVRRSVPHSSVQVSPESLQCHEPDALSPQSPLIMGGSLIAFSLNDRLDEMGNYIGIHASAQQCMSLYKLDVNKLRSVW